MTGFQMQTVSIESSLCFLLEGDYSLKRALKKIDENLHLHFLYVPLEHLLGVYREKKTYIWDQVTGNK